MDSDQDSMQSLPDEDYYYSDNVSEERDDCDGGLDEEDNNSHKQQQSYNVLSEADIQKRQEEDISKVSSVLTISRVYASILLHFFNWCVGKVHDAWFTDEDGVRKAVGFFATPIQMPDSENVTCGICFDDYPRGMMSSAACGHPFCDACWRGYIGASVADGPGCLMLRCAVPNCGAVVDGEMINKLALLEDREKYSRYLVRSYIEDNRKIKWCPAAGCEYAVEFVIGSGSTNVTCKCSYSFCWNCTEEPHRPVDCETVAKWMLKNRAESENINWILVNSKPCPKCQRPIEKDNGCMHITCRAPCNFQFCWLCLGAWSKHSEWRGYSCNQYNAAKKEGTFNDGERKTKRTKNSLVRYTHYYERWAINHHSRQKALLDLHNMQNEMIVKLSEKVGEPESQLRFITDAWIQIVECRRVLKWTYAYAYFLPECDDAKLQFFEYLQGEAESGLERLHKCTEKDLRDFTHRDPETPMKNFNEFRNKLTELTRVTKKYFENLVRALESGLDDVHPPMDQATSSKNSKSKKVATRKRTKRKKSSDAASSTSTSTPNRTIRPTWTCARCMDVNFDIRLTICVNCLQRRPLENSDRYAYT